MTARRLAWTLGGALAIVVLWLAWRLGNGPLGLAYAGAWLLAVRTSRKTSAESAPNRDARRMLSVDTASSLFVRGARVPAT